MPKYIALLRGINVGGNNKVEMKKLQKSFENIGFSSVQTYINTGNIIFESESFPSVNVIESAVESDFGFYIKVLIRSGENIIKLCNSLPKEWVNNDEMKTDVLFLWEDFDKPETIELIKYNLDVDTLIYSAGAIVWKVDKMNYSKSGMHKFVGAKVYKNMTARNINTVRKLSEIIQTQN
jgi:uncharacterized protein (DUF1697 family)